MLKWLDHWLKGVDTGIMDEPLVQVQDDSGVWRNEAFWPPESVVSASYWITPDSLDAGGAPAGGTIRYVDSNPPLAPMAAPTEVRLASAAVEEDVRLAGEARVHVRVAADQPRGVVVAELSVVDPDSGQWNRITWGGLNLRHHESLENGQLVVPQQEYAFSFPLHPVDAVVPAGHAIGLRLAGDGGEFLTPATGNAYTLHLGEDTYLELPWRPGTDVDIEDPQPEDVGCWAC